MNLKRFFTVTIALLLCLTAFAACEYSDLPTEAYDANGRFDYMNSNMYKYVAIDKKDYKETTVTIDKMLKADEEGVRAYIDILREEYGSATGNKITDRAVAEGDTVALYYEGYLNGEKFDGGSNMDDETPHSLKIGSGAFIPGFEDALVGIVPANTSKDKLVDITLTFPEDYHSPEMAGKSVVFKVYIEHIIEMKPAEYNEEFITKTLKYTTADKDVKASFEKYIKDEVIPSVRRGEILNPIWEDLLENAVIKKYPETEVTYYYEQYVDEYEYYQPIYEKYYGMKYDSFDEFVIAYLGLEDGADWKEVTKENAQTDIAQNLIFHYIAQKEGIVVTESDYQDSIQYYVNYYNSQGQGYTYTAKDIEENFGARFLKEHALFENVQDFLVENCNVIYE